MSRLETATLGRRDFTLHLCTCHDGPVLHAFGEGPRWNGFRTPIVTAEQFLAWIREVGEHGCVEMADAWVEHETGPASARAFGEGVDNPAPIRALVYANPESPNDGSEFDRWPPDYIDGATPVFCLDGWVWEPARRAELEHAPSPRLALAPPSPMPRREPEAPGSTPTLGFQR